MSEENKIIPRTSETQIELSSFNLDSLDSNAFLGNLISTYPTQKEYKEVQISSDIRSDIKQMFKNFGYLINNSELMIEEIKYLVLLVEPDWEENLEEKAKEFIAINFPEGRQPTHYKIMEEIESMEDFIYWDTRLKKLFPEIIPFDSFSFLKEVTKTQELLKEDYEIITSLGYKPFYMENILDPLYKEFSENNQKTLSLFQEIEKQILEEYKKDKNLVLTVGNFPEYIHTHISAYMYYKYRIPSFYRGSYQSHYMSKVSELLYAGGKSLIEDKIDILLGLPRVGFLSTVEESSGFFCYLEKAMMKVKFKTYSLDINSSVSSVEYEEYDLKDLPLIRWKERYNLNTKNITEFKNISEEILNLFVHFETKAGNMDKLLDLTNTCLLNVDGETRIAFVEDISVEIPSLVIPLDKSLSKFKKILNMDSLRTFYPLDIYLNYKQVAAPYIVALQKQLGKENLSSIASFPRHEYAMGTILDRFSVRNFKSLNLTGFDDYLTLGLWWPRTVTYRSGYYKKLYPFMDVRKSRKYTNFFSIFGGPVPNLTGSLSLREEFLV